MFEQFDLSKYGGKQNWAALTELNRLLTKHLPKTLREDLKFAKTFREDQTFAKSPPRGPQICQKPSARAKKL